MRWGTANPLMVLALLFVTAYGGMLASSPSMPGMSAIPHATPRASPASSDRLLYEALSPAYRGEAIAATDHRLSQYTITATFHPPNSPPTGTPQATPLASPVAPAIPLIEASPTAQDGQLATITGTQAIRFINDTAGPLTDLYLRLYPNLRQYDEGRMVVRNITVDDVPVVPEPPPLYSNPAATPEVTPDAGSRDLILLRLPLTETLPPNGTATVRMAFATSVPLAAPEGPGLFAFAPDTSTWTLAHWLPILAGYDPSSGWEVDPPSAWSDVTFSNTSLFDVTLTAPHDLVLVTPGIEVEEQTQGAHQVRRFVSGPVRDFAIVANPNLDSVSTEVNGTTVTSYYAPEEAAGGAQMLEWGTRSLAMFTELFGPYPYATLDLVAVPNVTGLEFPQLVFIGADFYADPIASGSRPGAIEFLVAHEVSHQWWYGLVGSNPHRHAFLDEGLAEYSAVLYFERQHGPDAAEAQLDAGLRLPYATMLLTNEDQVVDQPTAAFPDTDAYYATAYRKGGLGFAALREEIGDEAFVAGLHDYMVMMRFAVATPHDLQAAFERASGRELDDFWHLWFETASGQVEIVMEAESGTPAPATPDASPVASPAVAD